MKGLAAAMLLLTATGCSDALAPGDVLDWGAYQGTATLVDRGTTYSNVAFETQITQTGSDLSGSMSVGLSVFNLEGSVRHAGDIEIRLELAETPTNTSTGYVQPEGFAYTGSIGATVSAGIVEALAGSFEGPDGFGGEISVEFVADREL